MTDGNDAEVAHGDLLRENTTASDGIQRIYEGVESAMTDGNDAEAANGDPLRENTAASDGSETGPITYGRLIARRLSRYPWYNPHRYDADDGEGERSADDPPRPSLDAAWAYFEHHTLPRYIVGDASSVRPGDLREKAHRGDDAEGRPTRLYDVWDTAEADLVEFGLGFSTHFYWLRTLACLMFVAGLASLPNAVYFGSEQYRGDAAAAGAARTRGSAVCTDVAWVACPTCRSLDMAEEGYAATKGRISKTASPADGSSPLYYILKNRCEVSTAQGAVCLAVFFFVVLALVVAIVHFARQGKAADKQVQTADDYTLRITNPPEDARDPEEWRAFFNAAFAGEDGHAVTCCTVVFSNGALLRKLVERRAALRALSLAAGGKKAKEKKLQDRVDALTEQVQKMEEVPPMLEVLVTFETEHLFDGAWKALSIPWEGWCCAPKLPSRLLFRGDRVLAVEKSPTPSQIHWGEVGIGVAERCARTTLSFVLFAGVFAAGAYLVILAHDMGSMIGIVVITGFDNGVPYIVRSLLSGFEKHRTASSYQVSQYIKMAVFRITYTSLLMTIMANFTDMVKDGKGGLISQVFWLYIGMIFTQPCLLLLDYIGNFYRHVLGPRVVGDQQQLNLHFMGGGDHGFTERSTNLTKILFFTCWHSTIFPAGWFLGAAALAVQYWVDKYCLLRVFQPAPKIGLFLSKVTETFFLIIIVIYSLNLAVMFGGFPFDNACEVANTTVSEAYIGVVNVTQLFPQEGDKYIYPGNATVTDGDMTYKKCTQMLYLTRNFYNNNYNTTAEEWFTPGQTSTFPIMSIIASILVIQISGLILFRWKIENIMELVYGSYYKSTGKPVDARFSEETTMAWYIPQMQKDGFDHSFIACDISGIDTVRPSEILGWSSQASLESYNLYYDFPSLGRCFSVVRHWPPPDRRALLETPAIENETE